MFDINAFNFPRKTTPFANPRYGTAGVNILEGNGINTWDMALLKNVSWGDSYRIQFRWELFNAFNHASFGQPNPNPDAGAALRPCHRHRSRPKGDAVWLEVLLVGRPEQYGAEHALGAR